MSQNKDICFEYGPLGNHSWGDPAPTKRPTCTEWGILTYDCIHGCNETLDVPLEPYGHLYNDSIVHTTQPTCTEDGEKYYTCQRCYERVTESTIPALGHDWNAGVVTTQPTCTEPGVKTFTCQRCNTTKTETVDALGHSWNAGVVTTEPTCTEPGVKTFTCQRCNATKTETVDALGHSWVTRDAVPAKCEEDGYQQYSECSRCGVKEPENAPVPVAKLGHDWDAGVVTTQPTCTEPGVKTYICQRCKTTKTEPIASLGGHIFVAQAKDDNSNLVTPATCTDPAVYKKFCSVCGELSDDTFSSGNALGHSYGDWSTVSAPTCTDKGRRQRTCNVCGHVEEEELTPLRTDGEHQWGEWEVTKEAECGVAGSQRRTCAVCHITETKEIPAPEHQWGPPTTLEAATCTHAGTSQRTCSRCGATKTEEIPPLSKVGHSFNIDTGICSVCNVLGHRIVVMASGLGTASINGATPEPRQETVVEEGIELTITFIPSEGAVLDSVKKNGETLSEPKLTYTITAVAGGKNIYEATFKSAPVPDKKPVIEVAELTDAAIKVLAEAKIPDLIAGTSYKTGDIKYRVFNVEAKWSDGTFMTKDDLKANPATFTLYAPSGTTGETHRYEVWHFDGKAFSQKVSNGLTVTTDAFSHFAVYAFPQTAVIDPSTDEKTTRTAPDVEGIPFINDGNLKTKYGKVGAILRTTSEMQYRRSDEKTWHFCDSTPQDVKKPGTYYVRYPETETTKESAATEVVIGNSYTVTFDLLYGKGSYSVDAYKLPNEENIYLVDYGDDIKVEFAPADRYWLHEINVNGKYAGQENVKETFRVYDIDERLYISFGFSSSSRSPKTVDNSDLLMWSCVEAFSLFGMASITWYLFRRKE